MSDAKPRVVLDCMVYLQAIVRETSPAATCLRLSESREIELFISRQIIAEVQNVLSRDHVRGRFKTITDESAASFIERVRQTSKLIKTVPRRFSYEE
jgi:predicted nucleic acid-binding protein